jgi:DinB superfamily
MNPYASHLGDRDPVSVIKSTPTRLSSLVAALGPDVLENPPAPGKWSVRDILCHLADTELAFAFRLRQALAEPHHVIQPFDQEKWAASYPSVPASAALDAFAAIRDWNVRLLETVPPAALSKPVTHPERGQMTFGVLIETMAGHDLNHLRRPEALAAQHAPR